MERTRYMQELESYLEALLWQATDGNGDPLDATYSLDDLSQSAYTSSHNDLLDFVTLCEGQGIDVSALPIGSVGHDFILTRNHHGAGFWDRGLGDLGDALTKWAHTFGEAYLYVGDGGKLYV